MKSKIILYANKLFGLFGYTFKISKKTNSKYDTIYTASLYSPWNIDVEFKAIYEVIKNFTLVDIRRCYEHYELMEQIVKLPDGILLEVGVWRGGTGLLMAKKLKNLNDNTKVYLADTFTGVVKTGKEDPDYFGGEHSDTSIEIVKELAKTLEVGNFEILHGVFPEETFDKIKEQKIRYCHIDVDVYESAKGIINSIWENLLVGGIVVFDDYGFKYTEGINSFVNEQRKLRDRTVIYNLNGHAIIIKNK
jgi:O-methyltransferase